MLTNDIVSFEQLGPECCECSLEAPHRGGSNKNPQHVSVQKSENMSMFLISKKKKKKKKDLLKKRKICHTRM